MTISSAAINPGTVDLDGTALTLTDVVAAAGRLAEVRVTTAGRRRAELSAEFADLAAKSRALYGRSTGVGANRSIGITVEPGEHALMLLRSHATSAGAFRSAERVRAMLIVRLNQLAAGGSGVDPTILDALAEMIRGDRLPGVRESGSIGTGDLSALATTALALMGEGAVSGGPDTVPPVRFGPADGLGFISSNAGVLGDAALALSSLGESARAALAVAALTFHAVDGNAEAYSVAALLAVPFDGARAVSGHLRALIGADDDGRRRDGLGTVLAAARIQDPFGLRAIPQVHGPVLDALAAANAVVHALVNAPTENPLVYADPEAPGGGRVAHHAGFHQAYLQMALDNVGLAVAQSGQLVMARLAALIEPAYTGLPAFLGDGTPGASGVMVCEYVAASALGSMRASAVPAGLQTASLSRGVEEDASFASLAAAECRSIAEQYRQLLACELVAAVRANRMRPGRPAAGRIDEMLHLCARLPTATADRNLTDDLALAADLLPTLAAAFPGHW